MTDAKSERKRRGGASGNGASIARIGLIATSRINGSRNEMTRELAEGSFPTSSGVQPHLKIEMGGTQPSLRLIRLFVGDRQRDCRRLDDTP